MTITNGTLKYGQTVKTGDYENKRADVELSFTCAEGEDINEKLEHVKGVAHHHLHSLLGLASPAPAKPKEEAKKPAKKAVTLPKEEKASAPAEEDDPLADRAPLPENAPKPPKSKEEKPAVVEDDDPLGLGDLMGGGEPAKEITDKELLDAAQKCQAANKNAPAIRKILAELGIKTPPGRIIDLAQENRQKFLDKLKEVKPLA